MFDKVILSESNLDLGEKKYLANQVYCQLKELQKEYREFYSWYYSKVLPQINYGIRDIVIVRNNHEIAGIVITKNNIEKKICTIRVSPKYQKNGIGKILFETAFDMLETEKPIITVSESHSFEFRRIFKYYGFKLEKIYSDYYKKNQSELSYNGLLIPDVGIYSKYTKGSLAI